MIRKIAAAAALLCATTAQAGVVYNWTPIEPGVVGNFRARLEVDEAAYLAGSLRETYQFGCGNFSSGCTTNTDTLLIEFTTTGLPGIDFRFDFRQGVNEGNARPVQRFDLQFAGSVLSGEFSVNNTEVEMTMSGADLWSVTRYRFGLLDCSLSTGATACGTTGRWTIDAASVPVAGPIPEPGILPLMALASLGLGLSLRRRPGI